MSKNNLKQDFSLPDPDLFKDITDFYVILKTGSNPRTCYKEHFLGGVLLQKPACDCTTVYSSKIQE